MRIYSLSRLIALPFGILLVVLAYMEFMLYYDIVWWLLVPLVVLITLYILHGQIDYWWYTKNPIPLSEQERSLISQYIPYYRNLSEEEKVTFENRLSLYVGAREWKNVGSKDLVSIPDDVKALIASQCIMLTFNDDDFLLGDFDRIYTYKHPFPSPRYQFLHTVETDIEDGMIIYSMEHLLVGITNVDQYYNIGLHGYAEAYIKQNPKLAYPDTTNLDWSQISQITGFTKEQILNVLGFEQIDMMPLLIVCYFTYPSKMKVVLYDEYIKLDSIFNKV